MAVLRYFDAPQVDLQLMAEVEAAFSRNSQIRAQVEADPDLTRRFTEHASLYGGYAPAGVLYGMAAVGLPAGTPQAEQIAGRAGRAQQRRGGIPQAGETVNGGAWQAILNAGKAAVRGGLTGLSAPFEEASALVSSVGTAAFDDDPAFNPLELFTEQAAGSHLRIAGSQALRGEPVDLGAGFLPGGGVREQREREKERLQLDGTFVTPGRLIPAGLNAFAGRTVIEPGTKPYNFVSGLADFAANIALDPAAWALGGAGAAGKAARTFGADFDDLSRAGKAMASVSLLRGPRKSVIGESVLDFLERDQGREVVDALVNVRSANQIFRGFGSKIDPADAARLAAAEDASGVKAVLADVLGTQIARKPSAGDFDTRIFEASFNTARLPGVRRNLHGLRFAQGMPRQLLDLNEPKAAIGNFDAYLRNAKLPDAEVNALTDELIGVLAESQYDFERVNTVVGNANERVVGELIGRGVSTDKAKALTTVTLGNTNAYAQDARQFLLSRAGKPIRPRGVKTQLEIDGETIDLTGGVATMLVHARGDAVYLPDARALRREISWLAPLWDTPVIGGMSSGAVKLLGAFTELAWKPAQLLRPALLLRVLPEEQARIAAHGDASLFSHPVQFVAYAFGKKGITDGSLGNVADVPEFASVKASKSPFTLDDGKTLPGWVYNGDFVKGFKGQPGDTQWWAGYLGRFAHDDLAREVVQRHTDGASLQRVADAFWNGDLAPMRAELMSTYTWARTGDSSLADAENARAYIVDHIWGALTDATGGNHAEGIAGNHDLLAGIGRGEILGFPVSNGAAQAANRQAVAYGDKALLANLEDFRDAMPPVLPRPRLAHEGTLGDRGVKDMFDRAFDTMFRMFLTGPTDKLTRQPQYRQALWKEYDRLIGFMAPKVQADLLVSARKAGFKGKELERLAAKAKRGTTGQITDMAVADKLAHATAADTVKELLYDLSRRNQFSDIMRIVAPFAEPWRDVMGTWLKLAKENPAVVRRAQQGVEGARGSGAFYTDPATGEEKFAYPGGHLLTKLLGLPGQVDLTGFAGGLNLVTSSFLPGFGPAIQIPAALLMPHRPEFNGLRQVVFPFGEPETGTPGEVLDSLLPAWARRTITALNADPEGDRIFGNTVIETMQALSASGDYDNGMGMIDGDSQRRLEADAIRYAKRLYWVRALAQTTLPTGPQAQFSVDTPEGLVTLHALAQEFRDYQNEDYGTALPRFIQKFGFQPTLATQPKSRSVRARSTEKTGADWERANPDLVNEFPNTVAFFAPAVADDDFDYLAYVNQLETGGRVRLRPEDVLLLQNNALGRVAMDQARLALGDAAETPEGRATLARIREQLKAEYPGFQSTFGIPRSADTDVLIGEIRRAASHPKLRDTEMAEGVRVYLRFRDTALAIARDDFGVRTISRSQKAAPLRAWLREESEGIIRQFPEFAGVFDRVFSRELAEESDPVVLGVAA